MAVYGNQFSKEGVAVQVCWDLAGNWGVTCFASGCVAWWGLGGCVHTKLDSVFISFSDTTGSKKSNKYLLTDRL